MNITSCGTSIETLQNVLRDVNPLGLSSKEKEMASKAGQQLSKRRGIFLNLGLFQFLSFVRRGIFYTFMTIYLYDLVQSVTLTALLGSLNAVGSALGQNLLWGRIADRYRLTAKLVVMGETIAAMMYLIVFLVHKSLVDSQANFGAGLSLIIGLSVLEFFWSMSDVGWAALLTKVTTSKTRGGVVGTLHFVALLGRMIGINFAGFLFDGGQGFRQGTIFYIVIGMLLTGTLIMWVTSRSVRRSESREETVVEPTNTAREVQPKPNSRIYNWFLVSLIIIVIGTACVSQVFLLFMKVPTAIGGLNLSDEEISLILTAWTLGGMFMSLSSGWLADRIGRIKVLLVGMVLAAVTSLLYGLATEFWSLAVFYAVNGVSFWAIQTVGFAFAGDLIPEEQRGRLFSRYNAVMALSWGPAGLLVGGPLADLQVRSGWSELTAYLNTFYVSAVIVAVGTVVFAVKVARQKKKMR